LESEFFAETLLLLLSALKSSRRSYISFKIFFFFAHVSIGGR